MNQENLLKNKKILIVDDEPDILETLAALLPMCQIVKAAGFEEAKALLDTESFDMAVLDIMGVEGYKLLEIANKKRVIAVMLTAHALSPENIVKSYKQGAASYIPKEEMVNIVAFLNDILEAQRRGKNVWGRWLERLDAYLAKRFGSDWQKNDKDFWEKFPFYE